ncbi:hypothetical protein AKJ49_02115 [candidate division MSBL1 archaeon SCGC-AAA382A03]|uniref:Lactate racemase C-terminal domain-containing protein n=1 Tax=candidate division MSBL1 archaeon SCGC-AAA382A03 TaxID=1698278 RepID=A0A133VDE3_9EURY|nr:hypothetical protein AKJ49_02115 [candidate division MSBL1 archaeon SCGC-AAA382A03]
MKGVFSAKPFVKEGGTIVLLTKCHDGIGPELFQQWVKKVTSASEIKNKLKKEGYSPEVDHLYLLANLLDENCEIIIATPNLSSDEIKIPKIINSSEAALNQALKREGRDAKILAIPYSTRIIPEK